MIKNCRFCKNIKFEEIINLGNQPLSGIFPDINSKDPPKSKLHLIRCMKCNLIQLKHSANIKKMYGNNYGYNSSLSKLMVNHLKSEFNNLMNYLKPKNNISVLDIGSNDSTFLGFYKKNFFKLGIDPSGNRFLNNYKKNNSHLINDFFSYNNISKKYPNKKFDIITSYAMFYDIENPLNFCNDIAKLLNQNGVWNLELSYLPFLIQNMTYDQICHEHIIYYDLTMLRKILLKARIKILDVSFNEINGGSFNIICSKINSRLKINKKKIEKIIKRESTLFHKNDLSSFSLRVKNSAKVAREYLYLLKETNKSVFGYGASTKGNIVLNYSKIDNNLIKYICDANTFKLKKITPGSRIKIISKNEMRKMRCEYLFVLIWPFRKEVISQEVSFIKKGGKLIFPLPVFHIVDKLNYKHYLKRDLADFAFQF